MSAKNIYDFITTEEATYQSTPITVIDGYEWSMPDHIKRSMLYKHSQFLTGNSDEKPFKNIVRAILNLQYRAEGFDVKDIQLFVNSADEYYKSFLVRKFHDKWAREQKLDTFIDSMVESYADLGGVLVKNVNEIRPEVVPLQRLAFCDQTDILSGPLAEKHFYSPDQLREMSRKGWSNIEEVITLCDTKKIQNLTDGKESKTPGKYIEIYEVHGCFPNHWLAKDGKEYEGKDYDEYSQQIHIVAFYQSKELNSKVGITLYSGKEKKSPYKFLARDEVYGRALGFGGIEELFDAQMWVNYDMIRIKGMLDAASKIIYQTTDTSFSRKNKTTDLDNGAILVVEEGKNITQINTQPVNIPVFETSIANWEAHAKQMGAANESILGESPTAGTPFKLQELVTAESHSLHEYRKGKLATFLDEVYQDWIIPYFSRKITEGTEFLAELTAEELQSVSDSLVICEANRFIKEKILNGELVQDEEVEEHRQKVRDSFMKGGNKKFVKILKDELKDSPMSVYVNIAGKQKDLAKYTDKLVNVFRQILAAPQVLDDPRMSKIFNEILESSGLSPIAFYQKPKQELPLPPPGTPTAKVPLPA